MSPRNHGLKGDGSTYLGPHKVFFWGGMGLLCHQGHQPSRSYKTRAAGNMIFKFHICSQISVSIYVSKQMGTMNLIVQSAHQPVKSDSRSFVFIGSVCRLNNATSAATAKVIVYIDIPMDLGLESQQPVLPLCG